MLPVKNASTLSVPHHYFLTASLVCRGIISCKPPLLSEVTGVSSRTKVDPLNWYQVAGESLLSSSLIAEWLDPVKNNLFFNALPRVPFPY